MNEDTNKSEDNVQRRLTVTAVGNAWVICNSKSRPGFKYYFNTFSGQSVWNLSPDEVEKAKKYTKQLPVSVIEKCPEPVMDPPMNSSQAPMQQGIFNQTANNQLPDQSPNVFPMNFLNMSRMPGLPGISGINPFIWNAGPNSQMQTPPIIYVVAQPPPNFQPIQEQPQKNPTNMYSNPYERPGINVNTSNMNNRDSNNMFVHNEGRRSRLASRNVEPASEWDGKESDLRYKLVRKRSKSLTRATSRFDSCDEDENSSDYNFKARSRKMFVQRKNIESPKEEIHEQTSKYDLSKLQQLKPYNSNIQNWFIVVDTHTIIEHFQFLNKVTDPDQNCYLFVPDHVVSELEELVSSTNHMPTRRILRFLAQQIEYELAFRGERIPDAVDDAYKMYATCEDLAMQNNVILLSNDSRLGKYKSVHRNIHVLTLDEFEEILNDVQVHMPPRLKSPTLGVKIVVTNDKHSRSNVTPSKQLKSPTFETPNKKTMRESSPLLKKPFGNEFVERLCPKQNVQTASFSENYLDEVNRRPVKTPEPIQIQNRIRNPSESTRSLENYSDNVDHKSPTKSHEPVQIQKHLLNPSLAPISENNLGKVTHTLSRPHMEPIKTPKPVQIQKRLQKPSLTNTKDKPEINMSRDSSKTNTENCPQVRYRWRKQRSNINSVVSASKTSSINQDNDANTSKLHEASNPVDSNNLTQESNVTGTPVKQNTSPIRDPSIGRSSESSQIKRTVRPNITVEETSTSEVMSNTTVDSESLNSNSHIKIKKTVSVSDDVNFVKFEVGGQAMEELLRTRREEWVLRFVQIMEDALREILRDGSPFESKFDNDYTPPWATDLPELSKCIIKKFSDHFSVVDAANRLSFTLNKLSDSKGNISANIEPRQYMDMYSYGVYLIDALKHVTEDCEDLNTADDRLKKLMFDIQNENQEGCHNDTFTDELHDSMTVATEPTITDKQPLHVAAGENRMELRGKKRKPRRIPLNESPTKIDMQLQQRQLSSSESKFFSSLALTQRKPVATSSISGSLNTLNSTPNSAKLKTPPRVIPSPKTLQISPKNLLTANATAKENAVDMNNDTSISNTENVGTGKDNEKTSSSVATCFVRNFSSIAQFEAKLNKRTEQAMDDDYEDYYDYEPDNEEDNGQNYEEYNGDNELDAGEYEELEDGEIVEENCNNNSVQDEKDVDKKFEWFIKEYTGEIKQLIKMVQKLCKKIVEELKNAREPSSDMQEELKMACKTLAKIKTQLESILERDCMAPEQNIISLLKKANLEDFVPSKELLLEYTNIIKECQKQINTYHHIVNQIMDASGMQSVS